MSVSFAIFIDEKDGAASPILAPRPKNLGKASEARPTTTTVAATSTKAAARLCPLIWLTTYSALETLGAVITAPLDVALPETSASLRGGSGAVDRSSSESVSRHCFTFLSEASGRARRGALGANRRSLLTPCSNGLASIA